MPGNFADIRKMSGKKIKCRGKISSRKTVCANSTLGSISDVVIVIMFEGTKYLVVGLIGNICAQLALTVN